MVKPSKTIIVHHPDLDVAGLLTEAIQRGARVAVPPDAAPTVEPADDEDDDDAGPGIPEVAAALAAVVSTKLSVEQVVKALVRVRPTEDDEFRTEIAGKTCIYEGDSWRIAGAVAQDLREAMYKLLVEGPK